MQNAFGELNSVLITGQKFDLEKVLGALDEIIECFIAAYGGGRALLTTAYEHHQRHPWPDPGREIARGFWLNAALYYEALQEPLVYVMPKMEIYAYALGRAYCVSHRDSDLLTTPNGRDVSTLDLSPTVVVYGSPDAATVAAVDAMVRTELDHLQLQTLMATPVSEVPGLAVHGAHVALLKFPHAVYGAGHGKIRVYCHVEDDAGRPE